MDAPIVYAALGVVGRSKSGPREDLRPFLDSLEGKIPGTRYDWHQRLALWVRCFERALVVLRLLWERVHCRLNQVYEF